MGNTGSKREKKSRSKSKSKHKSKNRKREPEVQEEPVQVEHVNEEDLQVSIPEEEKAQEPLEEKPEARVVRRVVTTVGSQPAGQKAEEDDPYASMTRARESTLKSQKKQMYSQLGQVASRGTPIVVWRVMKDRPSIGARVNTSVRAFVQQVTEGGGLRVLFEDETVTRIVWLDDISLPAAKSGIVEEGVARSSAIAALKYLLEQKLVVLYLSRYEQEHDRLWVRLFMSKQQAAAQVSVKMIDALVRVQPADEKFKLPEKIDFCVESGLVNLNLLMTRVRGAFITMGTEKVDWFVRKSDWRRLQSF